MVDPLIVVQVVAGSNPVSHPIIKPLDERGKQKKALIGSSGWGFFHLAMLQKVTTHLFVVLRILLPILFLPVSSLQEGAPGKRIDGFILDSLKEELVRESRQISPDWERYDLEENAVCKDWES